MEKLQNLIDICNKYKQGEFGIEDFQSRILSALTPENASNELILALKEFDNAIEKIVYSELPSAWTSKGNQVADTLIQALQKEQSK